MATRKTPARRTAAKSETKAETPVQEQPVQEPPAARVVADPEVGTVQTKELPHPAPVVRAEEPAPEGIVLEVGEPIRIEGDESDTDVLVTKDVYRRVVPPNARRPSFVLLYAKGTRVAKTTLQHLSDQ